MKKFSINDGGKYVELSAPLKVYYDITTRCNLDCTFCFKGKCDTDVTWEQAKNIIKKIANASIPDVVFIGGEPMCCPFLFDALQYAKDLGLNPGIITNGTYFTDTNAPQLKQLVNNSISVSVHAPNDSIHDEISRGENVYTRIIEGLIILNKFGIVPELSFTPIQANIDLLFDTIDGILQQRIQISDILVNRLIPSGNALDCWHDKRISLDGQIRLLEQMEKLQQKYPDMVITSGDAIPFCMVDEKYRKFITRCDYAITLGWINEKNLFGKCMVRGSTGADSLEDNDIHKLWKQSQAFLEHRHMNNLVKECQDCAWLMQCGGGCACSGIGGTSIDAYFDTNLRYSMPPLDKKSDSTNDISITEYDLQKVSMDMKFIMKKQFNIRKEHPYQEPQDEAFLLLPSSTGAIIQDVISPDSGEILWINEIEKQIVLYMQQSLTVKEITKSISYEFNMSIDDAKYQVKRVIIALLSLDMVEKI